MEFIHSSSSPATIAELDLFKVPPTQTVIESMYDVEYRPIGSLAKATVFEFVVPPSEHYTDLAATYIYAKLKIDGTGNLEPTNNYAASLFEQLDVYFGTVNITPGNSLYHYQTYIDDLFFKYRSPTDACQMINSNAQTRKDRTKDKKLFDVILPIHAPMFQQEKFLIDGVPMTLRLKTSPATFGIKCTDVTSPTVTLDFQQLSLFIRRVKLFPFVQMSLSSAIEKSPAMYYFQRNEVKAFHLASGFASNSIDNVYNGQLPRKVITGFIPDKAMNGDIKSDPFTFIHKNLKNIAFVVNGVAIPSSPYKPEFNENLFMREYYNIFRSMNKDHGIPNINVNYDEYKEKSPLLVFDLTDDGTLAMDSGALSLVKRGNARVDINFKESLDEGVHMIVFGIYDSVLQIDSARNVIIDY